MSTNPFSPTPLGKDWTPPTSESDSEDSEIDSAVSEAAGLGSLFGTQNSGTPEPATITDLGNLFPSNSNQESQAPAKQDTSKSDTAHAPTQTPTRTPTPSVPAAPTVRVRARRRNAPMNTSPSAEADSSTTKTTTSAGTPTQTNQRQNAPVKITPRATSEASIAVEAVRDTPGDDPQNRAAVQQNMKRDERIWPYVDQTLAVIGADTTLQKLSTTLTLTQDTNVYKKQRAEFDNAVRPRMASAGITVTGSEDIERVIEKSFDEITNISVLGQLWRDAEVDEILVDRWDSISAERNGVLEKTALSFRSAKHAESIARALALKVSDRAVSRSIPLVTAELPSARVAVAFGSVVKGGLSVTIRKFRALLDLDTLLKLGSLNKEMVDFLSDAITARASILVSGGAGTGKTTIINLLSQFIPASERVITIEDAFELQMSNTHVVSLQTKEASSRDDTVGVTLADLLRSTLRMRPDRIIVGEIREGEGAIVMLAAANTGHDGTMTTIHANSPDMALNERLPDLVRQARGGRDDGAITRSVAGAFDIVLQVNRSRRGYRYVAYIGAITGVDPATQRIQIEPIFVGVDSATGVNFTRSKLRADTNIGQRLFERTGARWIND